MAEKTNEKPRTILKTCQKNIKEAAARLKRYPNVVQMIQRVRSTKDTFGQNPKTIAEIIVPIPLTVTYNNELFVWKDSGYMDPDRLIVFTTESNIKLLCVYKSWFIDGTFDVAPLIYKQMFNISANIESTILPMVYTLLPNKQESTYLKFFKMFEDVPLIQPKEVTMDFELATLNALLKVLPYVVIFLCWFHYCQNLWKNMQQKQLAKDYVKDSLVRRLFKYLKYLPFVPPKDVIKAFKEIKTLSDTCRKFEPMLTYFENFYIGKLVRNQQKIRKVPVYPINRWNVVSRVKEGKARTNNTQESWHKIFAFDAQVHPTFNKLVENFRLEQKQTDVIVAQIQSGDYTVARRKIQINKEEKLKEVVENYSFDKLFDYFDSLILIMDAPLKRF